MTRKEAAIANFEAGYNCSQAVLLAFDDLTGVDRETLAKMASSFGGGIGKLREVCGTVSGMCMAAGLIFGYTAPDDPKAKAAHYDKIHALGEEFRAKNGALTCSELLELYKNSGKDHRTGHCREMVGDAAEILEKYLAEHPAE